MNNLNIKKIIALALALVMSVFLFTACTDTGTEGGSSTPSSDISASSKNTGGADAESRGDASDGVGDASSATGNAGSKTGNGKTSSKASSSKAGGKADSSKGNSSKSGGASSSAGTPDGKETVEIPSQPRLNRGVNIPFGNLRESSSDWVFNAKYWHAIKNKGFDHVRVAVNFNDKIGPGPGYAVNPDLLFQVDKVVDIGLDAGLLVVLDFHGWADMNTDADGNKAKFYKIWDQLAKRYKRYPNGLLFELLNEPSARELGPSILTTAKLNEIQTEAIRIIRQTNPTRTIVSTVQDMNSPSKLWDMQLPQDDKNIIVAAHNYSPMSFTHQGKFWGEPTPGQIPFTDEARQAIRRALEQCREYQERTGRPVWVGEFGVLQADVNPQDVIAYAEYFSGLSREFGLGWCWWEFNDSFGLWDKKTDDWKPGIADALLK